MTTAREAALAGSTAAELDPRHASPHDAAVAAFRRNNPNFSLSPVAVVIPAYNEADCIGEVLERIPREACGLAV